MIPSKKLETEKQHLIQNCKKCHGNGCSSCRGYCIYIDKMAEAEIPVDYWYREMKNFYGEENFKNYINEYINNLKNEYQNGITIALVGERGRGKTMAACCVLKQAILEKFDVYYTTLSDLIFSITSNNYDIRHTARLVDFLTIDEVDQRFFPTQASMELFGNQLENILRSRMHNRMPTILCSNSLDISQIFGGEFKASFASLGSQFIKIIPATGADARKGKEKI